MLDRVVFIARWSARLWSLLHPFRRPRTLHATGLGPVYPRVFDTPFMLHGGNIAWDKPMILDEHISKLV
jgi:hypothetical protein